MTSTMSTIREDVEADTRPFDAAEALLSQWQDADKLSSKDEDEATSRQSNETDDGEEGEEDQLTEGADEDQEDQDGSEDEDQGEDEGDEGDEGEEDEGPQVLDNLDTVVKIKVDGEERTVSVKDLTRLYGQEAALTRKSQEVSELRKKTEDEGARFSVASEALLKKALERYAPYSKVDWVVAQSKLEPDELVALRNEARAAAEDVMFLKNQVDDVFEQTKAQRQEQLMTAAKECMDVLSNPETGIEGWSPALYDELRGYAVKSGMEPEAVDLMVDPIAFKILDKARRYDQAKSKATTTLRKKTKAAKKPLKSKTKASKDLGQKQDAQAALRRLQNSGSTDDAAAALMARWSEGDED